VRVSEKPFMKGHERNASDSEEDMGLRGAHQMVRRIRPIRVATMPRNFRGVKGERNTKTETMASSTKFAEESAAVYPGFGAMLIDFTKKTVATIEKMPITIERATPRVEMENSFRAARNRSKARVAVA